MIFLNLQRLCALRGIAAPFAFLRTHGFSHSQAHSLKSGAVKELKLEHLERLCRIFHCLPHDLLDYKPTGRGLDPANDILLPISKEPLPATGIQSLMASLPPAEVARLTAELKERYSKPS